LEKGFIDNIVSRQHQKAMIGRILFFHERRVQK